MQLTDSGLRYYPTQMYLFALKSVLYKCYMSVAEKWKIQISKKKKLIITPVSSDRTAITNVISISQARVCARINIWGRFLTSEGGFNLSPSSLSPLPQIYHPKSSRSA